MVFLLFISILSINCSNNKEKNEQNLNFNLGEIAVVSPSAFKEKHTNKTIIDIRTPREYKQGHLKGAVNINYYERNFLEQIAKYSKEESIFIYCRTGNRTSFASKKMLKIGFQKIYDLQGGIVNWQRNKKQIIK